MYYGVDFENKCVVYIKKKKECSLKCFKYFQIDKNKKGFGKTI